ncbi:MAG: PEP-CTERM sorting domain-containing protein [Verrucomicrobia bacterium]|nr:MAG: PEP-CTERM sorting domain-containing protein [Verrucomicrobiota bacterium]
MKTLISRIVIALSCYVIAELAAFGGYYNKPIFPGDNLIANQLDAGDNTLDHIFSLSSVPDGTTFTKWNPVTLSYTPLSVFDADSGLWSSNYSLSFGEGGVLHSPSLWTNLFVGSVYPAAWLGLGTSVWNPNYPNSLHLISSSVPLGGNDLDLIFTNAVGRMPNDGEWVKVLDAQTQTYTTSTFLGGLWDTPVSVKVGDAAWFDLGPVVVPEPAGCALLGLGGAVFWLQRRRRSALTSLQSNSRFVNPS